MAQTYALCNEELAKFIAQDIADDTGEDVSIFVVNGWFVICRETDK